MEILVNELSVHEQFHDSAEFHVAFLRLMDMRNIVRNYGREMRCHTCFLSREPIPGVTMQEAIGGFDRENDRRAAMVWLTKEGPFWDETREHTGDDWFEYQGEIVTDTAVGEAAFKSLHDVECGLLSFSPSDWETTPLQVTWYPEWDAPENESQTLENFWTCQALEDALRRKEPPIQTWHRLETICRGRFAHLTFTDDCFEPLTGIPFAKCSSERFIILLDILDTWTRMRDEKGRSTAKGRYIRQKYFIGDRALFSDSSEKEKQKFRKDLTFDNPEEPQESLFCPWHGKISHQTLRLHFSWPPEAGKPTCVVYAGPKITRR